MGIADGMFLGTAPAQPVAIRQFSLAHHHETEPYQHPTKNPMTSISIHHAECRE
jgi:hypothetical protein